MTPKPFIPTGRNSYYVRFQFQGREVFKSLKTSNLASAKKAAKTVFDRIHDEQFIHPRTSGKVDSVTLGKIEEIYLADGNGKIRSRRQNINALYKIIASEKTHEECQALFLEEVNESSVRVHIAAATKAKRPGNSTNSEIRQARAVFSKKAVKNIYTPKKISLPASLTGFMNADMASEQAVSTGYVPLDRSILVQLDKAMIKLKKTDLDTWKVVTLMRRCALRNSEILAAKGKWIIETEDGPALAILNRPEDDFTTKNGRECEILIDKKLASTLRCEAEEFLIGQGKHKTDRYDIIYRTASAFVRKYTQGRKKSLYELRKEAGSRVATEEGLFAAQALLRHSSQKTTERFYARSLNRPRAIRVNS